MLKYLVEENGCSLDADTFVSAIAGGQLETLKWLRENNCPWNERSRSYAARYRHFEIVKWLRENKYP